MMIGIYPCCGGELLIHVDQAPAFQREQCPHCGSTVWHFLSRAVPTTYLEADFLEKYDVNESTKTIKPR